MDDFLQFFRILQLGVLQARQQDLELENVHLGRLDLDYVAAPEPLFHLQMISDSI